MIQRQEKGDYLIEYKTFPVKDGMGMSAALMRYSLIDKGKKKIKRRMTQILDVDGGVIRKQVARITGTDQEAMDILFKDLQDNEENARIFTKPTINLSTKLKPLTRDFKGETLRLDRIGVDQ